jgi:hypothetical protein
VSLIANLLNNFQKKLFVLHQNVCFRQVLP